jgi:hypothetical protein
LKKLALASATAFVGAAVVVLVTLIFAAQMALAALAWFVITPLAAFDAAWRFVAGEKSQ